MTSFDEDRKSTRLNSSHVEISYAAFCLKKKNITMIHLVLADNERVGANVSSNYPARRTLTSVTGGSKPRPYSPAIILFFFFFNDTATTEIYTLSLHDALSISSSSSRGTCRSHCRTPRPIARLSCAPRDRKSTRLNSSHVEISYAVFCLKK